MPGSSTGLHSKRIGFKIKGQSQVEYFTNLINTTVTFDPPSLTSVATPSTAGAVSSGITMTGAALGDRVELFPPYDTQGIMFQGVVSAANTVKIMLWNITTNIVDLASGTWRIQVIRGS